MSLSYLDFIYSKRSDLQKSFPEVTTGNYLRFVDWAISVCEGRIKDTENNNKLLSQFLLEFKDFQKTKRNLIGISKVTELNKEQELKLEKNLVWVFGSARSGTTWLGSQLLSYKTLKMFEPKIALIVGEWQQWVTKNGKKFDRQSEQVDYIFSNHFKSTWMFYLRKLILNRMYSQFPTFSQKIVIKEPLGRGGSEIISKCLPSSKIVIIIRDGRDVIDSKIDAIRNENSWGVKIEGNKPLMPKQRLNFIKENSNQWVNLMDDLRNTYDSHSKNLRLLIRYEDLQGHTVEELEKIYEFLQIEIKKEELEKIVNKYSFENIPTKSKGKGKFTRFATPGKWKENFNEEEEKLMKSIMKKSLTQLGYEL